MVHTTCGTTAHCLRISAIGLVYSCAEYCCSTWLNSVHISKTDVELKKTMRIISGTVHSTPLIWLPTLSNIAPPVVRCRKALRAILDNDPIPLHHDVQNDPIQMLKSWKPSTSTAKGKRTNGVDPVEAWKQIWLDSNASSLILTSTRETRKSSHYLAPYG